MDNRWRPASGSWFNFPWNLYFSGRAKQDAFAYCLIMQFSCVFHILSYYKKKEEVRKLKSEAKSHERARHRADEKRDKLGFAAVYIRRFCRNMV